MYEVEVYLSGKFNKEEFLAGFSEIFPAPNQLEHHPNKLWKKVRQCFTLRVQEEKKELILVFLEKYAEEHGAKIHKLERFLMHLRVELAHPRAS